MCSSILKNTWAIRQYRQMSRTPSEWLTALRNQSVEPLELLSDPFPNFTHDLKSCWLSYYLQAHEYGYYYHVDAYQYAETKIQNLYPDFYQNWVYSLFLFLNPVSRPCLKKTQQPKPEFVGFHHITLTLEQSITHDDGKKYLTEYIQEYFLGQIIKKPNGKSSKPKKPIETTYCFEIGSGNNLHAHLFVYHPNYKLTTHNAPLKAYKYVARVEFCNDLNYALNSFNYIQKTDKKGSKEFIFPNPKLLQIIKKNFSN